MVSIIIFGYFYLIKSPSTESKTVNLMIEEGSTYSTIGNLLKEKGLIKSELAYKIYIKLNPPKSLEHGNYTLNQNYDLETLIKEMEKGSQNNYETISITFIEGKNMRYYMDTISSKLNISSSDIESKLKDSSYLDNLISKYWFLTKDIKDKDIYYSLEGYLYPDTYEFYTNATIEDVFAKLLDNMENKLNQYKESVEKSKYSIHEMITLASIIELEAGSAKDRKGVAGVFYNRLNDGWSLGSDVTTYYAEKLDLWSRDLRQSELDECNAYNTRNSCMAGKLPVGPVCNPGVNSLVAAIEPKEHNYYFFVADKNGKTYFNKTNNGHEETISELKGSGLWYEYD